MNKESSKQKKATPHPNSAAIERTRDLRKRKAHSEATGTLVGHKALTYDVYVSYAEGDREQVCKLAKRLKADGLRVWYDEWEIKAGDSIPIKKQYGLEQSRSVILCISRRYITSEWETFETATVQFRGPANTARGFIPLLLSGERADIPSLLRQFRYVDWRGEGKNLPYTELRAALGPAQRLFDFVEGERLTIYRANGESRVLSWHFPKELPPMVCEDAPSWKLLHTSTQKMLGRFIEVHVHIAQCSQATRLRVNRLRLDELRSKAEELVDAWFERDAEEFTTSLGTLPDHFRQMELYNHLITIPDCIGPIRRCLASSFDHDAIAQGQILVERICNWLYEALRLADLKLTSYLANAKPKQYEEPHTN